MTTAQPSDRPASTVAAVIVTYHPDTKQLASLVALLAPQVDRTIVVDNGSGAEAEWLGLANDATEVIALDENVGIAAAQNIGVVAARAAGMRFVMFFDQDSIPAPGHVEGMLKAYANAAAAGRQIASIGPVARAAATSARRVTGPATSTDALVEVDHLIAAGSLVPLEIFDRVGPLREDLFIDYVDIEWCLRGARQGLHSYSAPAFTMRQEFGTRRHALGFAYSQRSPMRQYYLVRNAIWLLRQAWVPITWKLAKVPGIVGRALAAAVFWRPHRAHWAMMARGISDGLAGRMGRGHD